jgi:hypothetical protein
VSVARRAPRGFTAVASTRFLFFGVAAWSSGLAGLAGLAQAQEEQPAPTATPPPAFEFDRAVGPLAFEVAFKLSDKDDAHLQILFDEVEDDKSVQEREILGLDFQPFEGARFVLSRSTKSAPLVSSPLQQVPEPKELAFKLKVELPQEGGLAVSMADGFPVVIALTPRAQKMKVQFAASGGVVEFTATKAERVTKLKLEPAGEKVMAGFVALDPLRLSEWRSFGWGVAQELQAPGPLKQVRTVDRREIAGGIVERLVVEFEEGVESPLVLARPKGEAKLPALLILAAELNGIQAESVRAAFVNGIAEGRLVAAFEPIGAGERRSILPHDDLHVPELELVGTSSFELAAIEMEQIVVWLRARPDVDPDKITLAAAHINVDGAPIAQEAQMLEHRAGRHVDIERLDEAPSDLPADVVRVGDDYLHLRFDSCQLVRALERREELPPPDTAVPLQDRLYDAWAGAVDVGGVFTIVFTPGAAPVRWYSSDTPPRFSKHVTIVASDRGMRVALEEASRRLGVRADETFVALHPAGLEFVCCGAKSLALEGFFHDFGTAIGPNAEPPRIFADGNVALPLLTTLLRCDTAVEASAVKFPISSFTAAHAIPSFDILLQRPFRAHRADPSLEVLTQGMPDWVFVPNALTRFEIEDVVIALTQRGLKIDWQDPVDSLRRPLTRHDRLAMWPQYRHAEFVR